MSEFIYLSGAEDVQRAGREMTQAAETMRRAAGEMQDVLNRFIQEFREIMENVMTALEQNE